MQIKKCAKCKLDKPIEEFIKTSSYCKHCRSEHNKKWRLLHLPPKPITQLTEEEKIAKYKETRNRRNEYVRKFRRKNVNYRISCSLRSRITIALNKSVKESPSIYLLGCSVDFYKNYLESKFTSDMNWDNYGTYWEIDHIIPCSHFDLSDPEQQKICFNYSNTKPLEKTLNRSKNNKYIG